ncbi:MAG TPA: ribose-5-phosphate isomerase RpiA [Acidobacteriaceae bacterium]|nr:ribose-5-phosphate isomerase RpiA [Acidobacteriaceae bacterium]
MSLTDTEKAAAARKSLEYVKDGMIVGLGSGSTATFAIRFLGEQVRQGLNIRGIPTSRASGELARSLNIPLTSFDETDHTDVTIDGADEVAPGLALIKGGGGALLHEKIVASSSRKLVIVADEHKMVEHLGHFPLPVEVIPFAAGPIRKQLENMGAHPMLRAAHDGSPYITDEGNYIYDCHYENILDPPALAQTLKSMTGVVEHGLFLGLASVAIIAGPNGSRIVNP